MSLFNDIWARRTAIKHLVLKNYRVRYRNMALGVLWSVLNPLVMLAVLVFILTYVFQRGSQIENFPIFVLIGLIHYNVMSVMLGASTMSIVEHSLLIKKVSFPRLIIPLSKVLSHLTDVVVLISLLLIFILLFQIPVKPAIAWMFVSFIIELIFILGMAFLFSALAVYYRDMLYIVESGLTVFFWLTPIFYSITKVHEKVVDEQLPKAVFWLYLLNPLGGCIHTTRRAVLHQVGPDGPFLIISAVVAAVVLILGVIVFQRLQRRFADFT